MMNEKIRLLMDVCKTLGGGKEPHPIQTDVRIEIREDSIIAKMWDGRNTLEADGIDEEDALIKLIRKTR